jgi:intracellular septation protein
MDKRLMVELLPGPAFLVGNALGGIFLGAGLGALATALAILLRWRWDRSLPWLAIAIFGLTVILLAFGLVLDDTTYIKLSNTIGSLVFAAIIAAGLLARPSLLERTLGHSIRMTARGWSTLHGVWIFLSLARAGANEIVWRTTSDQTWAVYNGVSDLAWIGAFVLATHVTAHRHWQDRA